MQPNETPSDNAFVKVLDSRNRVIRGLCQRGKIFYGRLCVEGKTSAVRVRLHGAPTVPQAVAALQALKVKRSTGGGAEIQVGQAPTLREAVASYSSYQASVSGEGGKRESTVEREARCFKHLLAFRPEIRLNRITLAFAREYVADRRSNGASGRSVDLEIIALRTVRKAAVKDGRLAAMPALKTEKLAAKPKGTRLLTVEEIEAAVEGAKDQRYGELFGFFLRLLTYCGGRKCETLRLRWDMDVDMGRKQLHIGRPVMIGDEQKLSKSGDYRVVDFNPTLESHLTAMSKRRQPGTEWMLPSPKSRGRDVPVASFEAALDLAVKKSGVEHFGFHHTRHYFISHSVMAGIDYMTIAKWVGHKDGGVLIGKVYGHLNSAHTARQAQKLRL